VNPLAGRRSKRCTLACTSARDILPYSSDEAKPAPAASRRRDGRGNRLQRWARALSLGNWALLREK
jgi:hypothetical protein